MGQATGLVCHLCVFNSPSILLQPCSEESVHSKNVAPKKKKKKKAYLKHGRILRLLYRG